MPQKEERDLSAGKRGGNGLAVTGYFVVVVVVSLMAEFNPQIPCKKSDAAIPSICNPSTSTERWETHRKDDSWQSTRPDSLKYAVWQKHQERTLLTQRDLTKVEGRK